MCICAQYGWGLHARLTNKEEWKIRSCYDFIKTWSNRLVFYQPKNLVGSDQKTLTASFQHELGTFQIILLLILSLVYEVQKL